MGRDHPRSRGEYTGNLLIGLSDKGSSPLSRGILNLRAVEGGDERIIPALAGNTWTAWSTPIRPRDHPRSRGEYGA